MPKIRIFLAEDDALLRSMLRNAINAQANMQVAGEAASMQGVIVEVPRIKPDVLYLDLFLKDGNSLDILQRLSREAASTRVLVVSGLSDSDYAARVTLRRLHGYLDKTAAHEELFLAIRAVHDGRLFIDIQTDGPALVRLITSGSRTPSVDLPRDPLSPREREVLAAVAQGHTSQQVADRLYLSVKTIETYRSRIMQKLALKDRADLVRCAKELGILDPL